MSNFAVSDNVVRELVWDGVEHSSVPAALAAIGLLGDSDDVRAMERAASFSRCENLAPIVSALSALTRTMGTIHAGMTVSEAHRAGIDVPDEAEAGLAFAYTQMIASSIVAILSQLMSSGLLVVPKKIGYL